MSNNDFFNEQKEQSLVKSTIVAKYFDAWANIMISTQRRNIKHAQKIAYIDLFAGPGRFNDNTQSTPLKILNKAINKKDLRTSLVTIFNDKDEENSKSLEKAISEMPNINSLKYKPTVYNEEVGEEIVKMFENMNLIPTLFFVDPWGYKGLSLRLINSVLKNWGCDAVFFFNYNRINMGLNNKSVQCHMKALFGENEIDELKEELKGKPPRQRELIIIEALCQSLKKFGPRYVLPFRFKNDQGERTSHHLIFVSKHSRGYEIMKEIMAAESTSNVQGVPSFEYNPADLLPKQSLLFLLSRPLEDLRDELLNKFSGQTISMHEIYRTHNIDTPYIKKNYKEVLRELYDNCLIKAISPKGKPPRRCTFGDKTIVTFPVRNN